MYGVMIVLWGWSYVYAETPEHHEHVGSTQLKFNYELLDFENSKQKEDGKRYGVELDHQDMLHHFQLYVEHTDTKTKPHVAKDLSVNKYSFKYQYKLNKANSISLSYVYIDDNLMKEVDGGNIYGLGFKYKALSLTQYISDYKHFNVYQSDIKWAMKRDFDDVTVMGAVLGKYIYIQNRESNFFTKNAKKEYFTLGLKAHMHYEGWHLGAGFYVGERIFAVMNEGLKVQHHAMAFERSTLLTVGKEFSNVLVHLRYAKHYAKEVPIANDNVEVNTLSLDVTYRF
jgi:hypothetical protein